MTEDLALAPFRIYARDDGAQQLWLFDAAMETVEDVFDGLGAESNGHGWESLAWWLTHSDMPDLADVIWFSSEAGTFVAGSSDPTALHRLAARLHAAFHDRSLLARLIADMNSTLLPRRDESLPY